MVTAGFRWQPDTCPIAYAIVTTVSPDASETPTSPIPTWGKPAAITAEPHPANVNQNVPIASAAYFRIWSIGVPPVVGPQRTTAGAVAQGAREAVCTGIRRC